MLQRFAFIDCCINKECKNVSGLPRVAVCLAQAALKCMQVSALKVTELQTQMAASSIAYCMHAAAVCFHRLLY